MSVKYIRLDEMDAEIVRYEQLTGEEIDAELTRYGIDPQPTIDSVRALVTRRLWPRDRVAAGEKRRR